MSRRSTTTAASAWKTNNDDLTDTCIYSMCPFFIFKQGKAMDNKLNKMRVKILPAALIAALILVFTAAAPAAYAASNFYITNMNVDVVVNEDDTYNVTESLNVTFTQPSHGIYRKIPYQVNLDRDGQTSKFRADIDGFKMLSSQKYKDMSDDTYFNIRFGDENKYENTKTAYKYSYVYDMKGDHLKNGDEFYFNFVGDEWEAQSIDAVTYKVHFPKKIDPDNVGVKAGSVSQNFSIDDSGKVISGMTTDNVFNGLTMRAVLPQGYFSKEAGSNSILYYIILAVLFVLTIGGMIMWSRHGRDKKMIRTVEIAPPDGLPSEVIGYLYDETSKGEHVISILLELANEGYVKIVETKKKSYRIECLKHYDGDNRYAKMFMDGLFKNYTRENVTKGQLKNKFYKTVEKIEKAIDEEYNEKLYDNNAEQISAVLMVIGFVSFGLLYLGTRLLNGYSIFGDGIAVSIAFFLVATLCTGGGFSTLFSFVNKKKVSRIFGGTGVILLGMGCGYLYQGFPMEKNPFFVAGFVLSAVIFLLAKICQKKTDWYVDTLGKITGYKDFLKKTEKDRIEKLVQEDPEYFYRNLAYAYVLDVTNAYVRQFDGIVSEPPSWYESNTRFGSGNMFSAYAMNSMMHDMMGGLNSSMTSSPSSSSGGGSFSSGGGAGGGGGGSW